MKMGNRVIALCATAALCSVIIGCDEKPSDGNENAGIQVKEQDAERNSTEPAKLSTADFQALVSTCAAGIEVTVDGELRGAIENIYEGEDSRVDANNFKFTSMTQFLSLLPEKDRIEGMRLYNECIVVLLGGKSQSESESIPEVYEIPATLVTYGEPLEIRAKTVISNDSEIRAFPIGYTAHSGDNGNDGSNGGNGANGSGGTGGNGGTGTAATNGQNGSNAGQILIKANQLIGDLRISNDGARGGAGGNGGSGGNGGNGGAGRNGASGAFDCSRGPRSGGSGGNAGDGGDGGRGGNGGDGGPVVIQFRKVAPNSSIVISSRGGAAGAAGQPGQAGSAGGGGPRGSAPGLCSSGGAGRGASGVSANNGRNLGAGSTGADGQIEVNLEGQLSVVSGSYSKNF